MLVRLSYTFNPWRAHLVKALLGSYGVPAYVWHIHALHTYAPGSVMGCELIVADDDFEAAVEILNAAPGEVDFTDEPGVNEVRVAKSYLPDLPAILFGQLLLFAVLSAASVLLLFTSSLMSHQREQWQRSPDEDLYFVLFAMLSGLLSGLFTAAMFWPLPWLATGGFLTRLFVYLWPRIVIFLVSVGWVAVLQFFRVNGLG